MGPPRTARSRRPVMPRLELVVFDGEIPEGVPRAREARHRHGSVRASELPSPPARSSG